MLLGGFALGFTFVMLCMNAMRAGLLTRFMGVLGMIVGATFVLPLDQQGVIRAFWLLALGFLIYGRWPSGMPPAWQTGEAVPWPSQAELREQRASRLRSRFPRRPRRCRPTRTSSRRASGARSARSADPASAAGPLGAGSRMPG